MDEGSPSRGTPGVIGDGQNPEEARKDSPLQVSEHSPARTLISDSRLPNHETSHSCRLRLSLWDRVPVAAAAWNAQARRPVRGAGNVAERAGPSGERWRRKAVGERRAEQRPETISLSCPRSPGHVRQRRGAGRPRGHRPCRLRKGLRGR